MSYEAVADVGDAVPTVPPLPDALPTAGEVRGSLAAGLAGEGNHRKTIGKWRFTLWLCQT